MALSPLAKSMLIHSAEGRPLGRQDAHVINLQLDGHWVPLEHVAVDVVGKYRCGQILACLLAHPYNLCVSCVCLRPACSLSQQH